MSASNVTGRGSVWVGIFVALAAAAGYALANTSASVAYQGGSNALTVAATRFLVPTAGLIGWLHLGGVSLVLPKRDAVVSALLGVATALYNLGATSVFQFDSVRFGGADLLFVPPDSRHDCRRPWLGKICLADRCGHIACSRWAGAGA